MQWMEGTAWHGMFICTHSPSRGGVLLAQGQKVRQLWVRADEGHVLGLCDAVA